MIVGNNMIGLLASGLLLGCLQAVVIILLGSYCQFIFTNFLFLIKYIQFNVYLYSENLLFQFFQNINFHYFLHTFLLFNSRFFIIFLFIYILFYGSIMWIYLRKLTFLYYENLPFNSTCCFFLFQLIHKCFIYLN